MQNLQNYGVQELTPMEINETEGGFIPLLIIGGCLLLAGCGSTFKATVTVENRKGNKVSGSVEIKTSKKN